MYFLQDPEAAIAVISHFNQMISLLRLSRDDTTAWKKCKDFWMKNRCSDNAIKWLCDLGKPDCTIRLNYKFCFVLKIQEILMINF